MHEDDRFVFRQNDIGLSENTFAAVLAKTKPQAMKNGAHNLFGFCVARANARHVPASVLLADAVHSNFIKPMNWQAIEIANIQNEALCATTPARSEYGREFSPSARSATRG